MNESDATEHQPAHAEPEDNAVHSAAPAAHAPATVPESEATPAESGTAPAESEAETAEPVAEPPAAEAPSAEAPVVEAQSAATELPPEPAEPQPVASEPAEPQPDTSEPAEPAPVASAPPEPEPVTSEPQPVASETVATEGGPDATEPAPSEREPAAEEPGSTEAQAVAPHVESSAPAAVPEAAGAAPVADARPHTPAQPSPKADERRQRAQQAWERALAAHEGGEILTGTVTAAVKGGLLVDVNGIRGFLPASQVRVPIGTAIETLVKTKVPLKVIDVDQTRRRIVVSHRRAAEEERRTKRTELLRSLAVGQTREGVVVRLADFGAFVDLGGVDGLIPMRELAFERIDKAGDVVTIGEKLQVEVLRIDEGGKKISLSRRNALPDPWRDHADVLRQGSTVNGKVVGKEPRLQVELAPGIVGSVRESDADPADYELGEAIEVLVRRVDRATRRITLSTLHGAAALPPPQTSTSSGFAPLGVELGRRS